MDSLAVVAIALVALLYATFSKRIHAWPVSAPMIFVGAGMLLSGDALSVVSFDIEPSFMHHLAEFTLVFLLFADASTVNIRALRKGLSLPVRLLLFGLPLTILAGVGVGMALFPTWPIASLLVLAAILAPTDAALGQAVVEDPRLPEGLRRGLLVESGLNDGIAVPVVVTGIALSSMMEGEGGLLFGVLQITVGPVVGVACGWAGGRLLDWARARDFVAESQAGLVGLAIAALSYALAEVAHGNGFISVFVSGMTIGAVAPSACTRIHTFVEREGQVLVFLVFTFVGCLYAFPAIRDATAAHWLYAALSLTVVRMVPVALALMGSGLHSWSRVIAAWFGPRGIATVVFAIVVLEAEHMEMSETVFSIAMLTVSMSVVAHGVTAAPAAALYAKYCSPKLHENAPEHRHLEPDTEQTAQ